MARSECLTFSALNAFDDMLTSRRREVSSEARPEVFRLLAAGFVNAPDLQQGLNATRKLLSLSSVRVVTLQSESRKDCEEVKCYSVT